MKTVFTLLAGLTLVLASSAVISTAAASDEGLTTTDALLYMADEQHEKAYKTFRQFLPFGSQDAAYHLGMLSIEGNGTDYDPIKALGYLYAARDWGSEEATEIIEQIEPHLSDAEREEAERKASDLSDAVIIDHDTRGKHLDADKERRKPVERVTPRYPDNLARSGDQGWVYLLLAIDKSGSVVDSISLNNPDKDMERSSQRALRRWEYEKGEAVETATVMLNFEMHANPGGNVGPYNQAYERLLPVAELGRADAQFFMASLLLSSASNFDDFLGADDSSAGWLSRSAANGYTPAQRSLALANMHDGWARYLIAQGDTETMAWYGARLVTDAEDSTVREEGRTLVEQAAEAGYRPARRLLAALDD